jgi:hypothetical protein
VFMALPRATPPLWFCRIIEVREGASLVVVDDDQAIHQIWRRRCDQFGAAERGVSLVHLNGAADLEQWCEARPEERANAAFLVDYEFLGASGTGLAALQALDLCGQSILVTSHDEELEVRAACVEANLKLLPKSMAAIIPIRWAKPAGGT